MPISESALRGRLQRKGYALRKSRARNEYDSSFGRYHIVDPYLNAALYSSTGYGGYGLDLEDVEAFEKDLEHNSRI